MKKYISPRVVVYNITKSDVMQMLTTSDTDADMRMDTKEEKSQGSGIWDLY